MRGECNCGAAGVADPVVHAAWCLLHFPSNAAQYPERLGPSGPDHVQREELCSYVAREELNRYAAHVDAQLDEHTAELTEAASAASELGSALTVLASRQNTDAARIDALTWWVRALALVVTGLVILLGLMSTGCSGQPFTGASFEPEPSDAGAGGEPSSMPSAGAGGSPGGAPGGSAAGGMPEPAGGAGGGGGEPPRPPVPCVRDGWHPSAFASFSDAYGGPPALALDGDEGTRWTGGAEQAPGQWFEVELPSATTIAALEVASVQFPSDAPIRLRLVLDGEPSPATVRELRPGTLEVTPPAPRSVRRVRFELLEERPSWWSIDELTGWCGGAL